MCIYSAILLFEPVGGKHAVHIVVDGGCGEFAGVLRYVLLCGLRYAEHVLSARGRRALPEAFRGEHGVVLFVNLVTVHPVGNILDVGVFLVMLLLCLRLFALGLRAEPVVLRLLLGVMGFNPLVKGLGGVIVTLLRLALGSLAHSARHNFLRVLA